MTCMSMAIAAADLFGMAEFNNVNIACDWLSHGSPLLRTSRSTVFDRLEIGLTLVKPGAKKNANCLPGW